ncbi:unnamed protein product [Ceutorhynchus assimilis]|uniref:Cytochrome P450 n=1 Tax=Ceutorhynchus assimilis TaxID=467358 RepID=A0A9N9MRW1_9CUCU|nr:unnamed protein product [Ceutorhynchus assimilis]
MLIFWLKILYSLVLCVVVYNVWLILTYNRIVRFSWKENGRWMLLLPFVGNTYVALFTGRRLNMLTTLLWAERFIGLPVNFWFGHKYHYMCNSAEEARIVLNHPKCYNKAQLYKDVKYIFRNSLLLIEADKWKPRRRFLRNAFKSNMLKSFFPTFYQQSFNLVERLKSVGPEEDYFKFFNKYAFMNFFLTSVGWRGEYIDPNIEIFGELIDRTQDEFVKLLANPLIPAYIWINIPPGAKLKSLRTQMKTLLTLILQDKKQEKVETSEYVDNPKEGTLLDLLLSDGYEKETESDVFEELVLFAGAATDTTGHTFAFCFTLLGMYPDIQHKVYEEVMSVVGDHSIEETNIKDLHYTEAVISETLRLLPTIPLYGRYCEEDIDIGTKVVPKGASIFISAYHIHRNPDYWKNPLRFDPNRFLPENISKIIPGSYLPFSAGPRNCIGQGMALTLLKITVANIVRHFEITSKHKSIKEFKLESCISMKTYNNLDCHFTLRVKP